MLLHPFFETDKTFDLIGISGGTSSKLGWAPACLEVAIFYFTIHAWFLILLLIVVSIVTTFVCDRLTVVL